MADKCGDRSEDVADYYCLDFSDIVGHEANGEEEELEEDSVGASCEAELIHQDVVDHQHHQDQAENLKRGLSYNCTKPENEELPEFFVMDGFNLYKSSCKRQEQLLVQNHHHQDANHVQVASSLLRLNYDDVLSSWCDDRSLWTDGKRPQTVPEHFATFASSCTMISDFGLVPDLAVTGSASSQANSSTSGDHVVEDHHGSRVARVTRYREKKRSRLFAKKIRYEVRKVNAESRPRMKGRFVKRTSKSTVLQR